MENYHVYPSNLKNESRIAKITNTLIEGDSSSTIVVVGKLEEGLLENEILSNGVLLKRIGPLLLHFKKKNKINRIIKTILWYFFAFKYLFSKKIDVINAHSLPVLPLCVAIKLVKKCVLIYDTHELETEVIKSKGITRLVFKITEKLFIRFCDYISVVNYEISEWYKSTYRIKRKIYVVRNIPVLPENVSGSGISKLKLAVGLPQESFVALYQGLLSNGRGIDQIIEAFKKIDPKYNVVFMGYGPMESKIKESCKNYKNIHFLPAVSPDVVLEYTAGCDLGLCLIENVCLSYYLSLPNKLFEYIAVGKPVLASSFPAIKNVLSTLNCGWAISPDKIELIKFFSTLSAAEYENKKQSAIDGKSVYSWAQEEKEIKSLYKNALSER